MSWNSDISEGSSKIEQISAYYQQSFNNIKSNQVDFAKAFQEICRHIYNKPEGLDGKTPLEAANFLVNQDLITTYVGHLINLYSILHLLHTHQFRNPFIYEIKFIIKIDEFRFYRERINPRDYCNLGNCVLVTDADGLNKCETPEERIAFIYSHLPFDQNLPPQGTEITTEFMKQRTINIVAQLLEVIDFDRTEHLRLAD